MSNNSRSLARLFSLEAMVNDQVLRGTRSPYQVAEVLQVIIDDPEYAQRFFPPEPVQTEPFKILEEIDLEVDFSLTSEQVLDLCQNEEGNRRHGGKRVWAEIGQPPFSDVRHVRFVVGQAGHGINGFGALKKHVNDQGLVEPGAWVAVAYAKLRPKWDKSQHYKIVFPLGQAEDPCDSVIVGRRSRGPWKNHCHLASIYGVPMIYGLIRKD